MSDKVKCRLMIAGAAFCAALFLFSGAMLAREYLDQKKSAEAFEEVAEDVYKRQSIMGNCDEFLYLGGNESSTHKLISESHMFLCRQSKSALIFVRIQRLLMNI